MKIGFILIAISLMFLLPYDLEAEEHQGHDDVLAQRGQGIVTQADFEARANKIPKGQRQRILRDRDYLQDIINGLLIDAQLAFDAREAGFDTEQTVIDRMTLAAESELAAAWLDHYVELQPEANLEQLAYEYYLVNQDSMMSPAMIDVSHILISTQERDAAEAEELADSLYEQLVEQPSRFDQFVLQYSEDPKAQSTKGRYTSVKKGDMVKPFEKAAFALQEGEISSPVRSNFGYHLIRLDTRIPPAKRSFDEVKTQLMERVRKQHEDRIKKDYLARLSGLNVSMTKEALDEAFRRQFGDEISESPDSVQKTE